MSAGKGSSPRNCFSQQYRDNYDRVFRGKKVRSAKPEPEYRCVMENPPKPIKLKSKKWTLPVKVQVVENFSGPTNDRPYTDPYWNQCACGAATRSKRKLCPQCRNRKGIPLNPPDHPWRKQAQQ